MHQPSETGILLAVILLTCGAAASEKATTTPGDSTTAKAAAKPQAADDKTASPNHAKPACMHCGATCGLVPVCVCEPGTKKKPKNQYQTTCEPICVPGCSTKPWPFGGWHDRTRCTSCCAEPCACPGWVRNRKTLKRETVEEDVPTIQRKVAYICDPYAGRGTSCCDIERPPRPSSWWSRLTWWMPEQSAP
jgi:hypothetical protein